jgi:hypothetical protein
MPLLKKFQHLLEHRHPLAQPSETGEAALPPDVQKAKSSSEDQKVAGAETQELQPSSAVQGDENIQAHEVKVSPSTEAASQDLWGRAYEALRKEDSNLVKHYELVSVDVLRDDLI